MSRADELAGPPAIDVPACLAVLERVVEAHKARCAPFASPDGNDATVALRYLRTGVAPIAELRRLSAANAELLGALKKARAALQGAIGMKLIDGTYADKDCSITMAIITSDAAMAQKEPT